MFQSHGHLPRAIRHMIALLMALACVLLRWLPGVAGPTPDAVPDSKRVLYPPKGVSGRPDQAGKSVRVPAGPGIRTRLRTRTRPGPSGRTPGTGAGLAGAALRHEVADSKEMLEARLNVPVLFFCYPYGKYSPAVEAVAAAGYVAAVTGDRGAVTPDRHRLLWPRLVVTRGYTGSTVLAMVRKAAPAD